MNTEKQLILFDEDEKHLLKLQEQLNREKYKVVAVKNIIELERILRTDKYLIFILCIDKGTEEIFNLIKRIKGEFPFIEIIVLTKRGDMKSAFNSLRVGACNYITESDGMADLMVLIDIEFKKALKKYKKAASPIWTSFGSTVEPITEMIGNHSKMIKISKLIQKIACTHLFVLITGETGVGKELVARLVHHHSARRKCPFISFNCAAIPDTLLESELFGHEKGAFTDAVSFKIGRAHV